MIVGNILKAKGGSVVTLDRDQTIAGAIELLNRHNIGALVVVDQNGAVTGILSERDIVRRLQDAHEHLLAKRVGDCMTPNPVTCTPQSTIDELMGIMTTRRIRHMPVVENGVLVGVMSIGDVVKRKIEEAEADAEKLREYIAS